MKPVIWVVIGTRPEAIKQIPVVRALRKRYGKNSVKLVSSGQHKELLTQVLQIFGETIDLSLPPVPNGSNLSESFSWVLKEFSQLIQGTRQKPSWVLVQGDTTTSAASALAAFHSKIPVAHSEAGLRSYDLHHPFPEEANRKIISQIAKLHFAPTRLAAKRLREENIPKSAIKITGNTGIDALKWALKQPIPSGTLDILSKAQEAQQKIIFMTAHRRENAGSLMNQWFSVLAQFLEKHQELLLVYPQHPNGLAADAASEHLRHLPNVLGIPPLDYVSTAHLLTHCKAVVTDSGGIQEEAAAMGVPVVVCRETTERPEGVIAGRAKLVGSNGALLRKALLWATRAKSGRPSSLYGTGKAGESISRWLK